ncbi:hypothetical protein [uncultured Gimesia sp.]|uniref:hypothetical protein n=1 Tax=uncultured Gimesia sp. TaxID=1678688 RepID=UPI0026028A01|nr:hypothetical protein [uncultured Gimesia sp.]
MRNRSLAMSGSRLTEAEAASLEKQVEQDPQDIDSRTKLLGYYFLKQQHVPSAREAKQRHILWLIQNAPESEVLATPYGLNYGKINAEGYSQGKEVWLDKLKTDPENLTLLEYAAKYFMLDDQELAEECLLKAQSFDNSNQKWPAALGQLYSLNMIKQSGTDERTTAQKALEQLENAYDLSAGLEQDVLLAQLAKAALVAQEITKARGYAEKMLSQNNSDWNSGNHIHHGNITLGRIAIAADDVEAAKQYLINAGKTSGSPQLNSFGPDMSLAKELL